MKMTKYSIANMLLAVALVCSCVEEEQAREDVASLSLVFHQLSVSDERVFFDAQSDLRKTITIKADNTDWEIIGCPEWLTLSPLRGHGTTKVLMTAKENKSADVFYAATMTVRSMSSDYHYSKVVAVAQAAAKPYITPEKTSVTYSFAAQSEEIKILSNVDWQPVSSATWLTATKVSGGLLRVQLSENTGDTREGTIYLQRDIDQTKITYAEITVTQGEAGVTGSLDTLKFEPSGGTLTTTIDADVSWTANSSNPSWLNVTPSSGQKGKQTLSVTALELNSIISREGYVYVKIGSKTKLSVPVKQTGIDYRISTSSISFESVKSQQSFTIKANSSWKIVSAPSWLTLSESSGGEGSTTITASVEDNPNASPYYGEIIIGKDGFYGNRYIPVSQKGKTFEEFGSNKMEFLNEASSSSVEIKTNGHWEASADKQWIHLSPTSGDGNGNLNVSVDKNNNKDARSGIITVKVGTTVQQITVNQEGQYVNLTYSGLLKDSKPATIEVTLTSNAEWTASSSSDWLTVSPSNGSGNSTIEVSVADNPSVNSRTGNILVSTVSETKMLTFTQPGRTLSLSTDTIGFTASGGTSESITITTDGQYKITTSDSWLQIEDKGNSFTIKTSENTGDYSRTGEVVVSLVDLKNGEKLERRVLVPQSGRMSCPDSNHPHAIDLGLPSGTKWACCNVGASKPEDYGNYYAWGETTTKSTYDLSNYKWRDGNGKYTKYNSSSIYGTVDSKTTLDLSDDAARVNWASPWRMPTLTQIEELLKNTTHTWTTENGVAGFKFTGSNGATVFLPAAGLHSTAIESFGMKGYYWSSTLDDESRTEDAYELLFNYIGLCGRTIALRYRGQCVRPVR